MTELSQLTPMRSIASMSSMSFTNTHDDLSTQSLELITINDLYDTEDNLGHIKEIHELKGRTMVFKISAKKEHYVRRNIPFPVVKIKTDQLLLQQLCPDLLALDENDFNSDGPISEGDDKFLEDCRFNGRRFKPENWFFQLSVLNLQSTSGIASQRCQYTPTNFRSGGQLTSTDDTKVQSTGGISYKGFQDTPSNLRSVGHLTSSVVTKVQSMPPISSQVLADTPTNLRTAIHLTSSVSTKATGGISSKGFQDTPSNLRSVGHFTSSVVTKVQSMPPISSQVLEDTPTNFNPAIHLPSSVSTKVQAFRGRSSQSFQVNTTNCHAIGQLPSQNLTTETRNPTNRVRSNVTIHPARNLEEEFSATLHDTSKVMEDNFDVVVGSVQHEENNVPKCIPTINGVEPTCSLPSTSLENIQDVDNVQSVSPQINTNVQTSSGVDINHTIVIPPAPDGEYRRLPPRVELASDYPPPLLLICPPAAVDADALLAERRNTKPRSCYTASPEREIATSHSPSTAGKP
nr:uncharacterized protein LOC109163473 [Ipomoea batatas]